MGSRPESASRGISAPLRYQHVSGVLLARAHDHQHVHLQSYPTEVLKDNLSAYFFF